MIELLLAAHIYITNIPTACHQVYNLEAYGCYFPGTNEIYISPSVPKIQQYIIFYHEVGHMFYGRDEYTAEQFAMYMMAHEQPIWNIFLTKSFDCDTTCKDIVQAIARSHLNVVQ